MAEQVSALFRQNCYDLEKKQRLLLRSNKLVLSNEDISVTSKVKFNIASITSTQQVQFGCTPMNSISVSILNDDGRVKADSIVGDEFHCDIGVEVSDDDYMAPSDSIAAVTSGVDDISVHSVSPYVRGNCTFESILPELMMGYKCKILYVYDTIYFVVTDGEDTYYAKHEKTGLHMYGEYEDPSDTEKAILDRLMFVSKHDAVAYYDGGMTEFTFVGEPVAPGEWHTVSGSVVSVSDALAYPIKEWVVGIGMTPTASGGGEDPVIRTSWTDMLSKTWGGVSSSTWGGYSGYTIFNTVHYESVSYGVWRFDRPRRINSAVLTLSGKDRMKMFDEDSANFASSMPNSLMSMRNMIVAIANYKGVPVGNLSGLNALADAKKINPRTYYQNKSLKDLLSYAFEVCGANCIIDRHGCLSASNADNVPIPLPYVYTFDVADSTAHTVSKMLVFREAEQTVYQEDNTVTDGVVYDWSDNPFFDSATLGGSWFSNSVNKKYGGFRNAITVSDADYSLWADDVYSWTDESGTYREPIFTMSVEWGAGGTVTYTNYGDEERQYASYGNRIEGVTSTNDVNLQGYNQAKYNDKLDFSANGLTVNSNGLRIKNAAGQTVFDADTNGNLLITGKLQGATGTFSGQLQAASGDFEGVVIADEGRIGKWEIVDDNLKMTDPTNSANNVELGIVNVNNADRVAVKTTGEATSGDILDTVIYHNGIFFRTNGGNRALIRNDAFGDIPKITFQTGLTGNACGLNILCSEDLTIRGQTLSIGTSQGEFYFDNPSVIEGIGQATAGANAVLAAVSGGHKLYINTSLRAVKDNIKTIENASESVDNLRGVSFTSKCEGDDPNRTYYGFIAEEVEEAVPELASYANGKLQSVQYDRVCALLVEDNKACHRRIEELERRLADLEKRLK